MTLPTIMLDWELENVPLVKQTVFEIQIVKLDGSKKEWCKNYCSYQKEGETLMREPISMKHPKLKSHMIGKDKQAQDYFDMRLAEEAQ